MTMFLLILAALMIAGSGLPSLVSGRRSARGPILSTAINMLASALGIAALLRHDLAAATPLHWVTAYRFPIGKLALQLDDLSAWFLLPIFLISALGSVYGLGYWPPRRHPADGRKLRLFWGIATAGMILVVLAANSVEFLIAWEIMAMAGYFLLITEDRRPEVQQAGWVYFIATHIATLCLIAFFVLLRVGSGSLNLWPTGLTRLPAATLAAVFILGLVGFGCKAGLVPLHVWLPGAHANAPSHVSALFSGVMLNMGVYGIVRVAAIAGHPPIWWGAALLSCGTLSAFLGMVWACAQRDCKRLLAYSSIENIGILMTGLGLAVLGLSLKHPLWVALGLGGSLLHMLNHSLFKPLLFMGAGGIIHGAGTRDLEALGGLARRMPTLFWLMLVGAASISALPPWNGFVSELLIYLGLFKTLQGGTPAGWAALAVPLLAMVGALAMTTFIKFTATSFAGQPRTAAAANAHEPGSMMLAPMLLLAAGCTIVGIFPQLLAGLLDHAIRAWTPGNAPIPLGTIIPLDCFTAVALTLVFAGGLIWVLAIPWRRARIRNPGRTWGCGYISPNQRMQYTGSSLTQILTEMLRWLLWSTRRQPRIQGVFPQPSNYASHTPDPLLDGVVQPALHKAGNTLKSARIFQSGTVQLYLLYVLLIVLALLLV